MELGQIFGKWTVLSLCKTEGKRLAAEVRCECGYEQIVFRSNLTSGKSTMCKKCSYANRGPLLAKRIGGDHLAAKDKYNDYKVKARQRGIEFKLTFEEFLLIVKRNCQYCGEEPSNVNRIPEKEWAEDFIYNGIDRYENSTGYVYSNCVPCCKMCNYSKRDLSYTEFIEKAQRIAWYASKHLTK